uniref:SPRY domain-containing SOCS box protein 1 n=1 Tax=Rhabditophanes sp. KR3021 TaxID=114890 RepID=A0AC35TVA9_9BILA
MGQRASMEEDEINDTNQLDVSARSTDTIFMGAHLRMSYSRNSFLEIGRARPLNRSLHSTKPKSNKSSHTQSPAFPGRHEMLYQDDLTTPARLEQLLRLEEPDKVTMEAHAWNTEDRSLNIYVREDDPFTMHRHPVAQSTDCIRGKMGYSTGFHVWRIKWPTNQRGTHAIIGVANQKAKLHALGYNSLIGSTRDSYGFNIVNLKCSNDSKNSDSWTFPTPNEGEAEMDKTSIPETIYCILDMDEGYMGFATDKKYLGVAFRGLKGQVLYPIVSAVWGHCEISLNYLGGLQPEPPRLIAVCRKTIRHHMGKEHVHNIEGLPIPPNLKNYLQFK